MATYDLIPIPSGRDNTSPVLYALCWKLACATKECRTQRRRPKVLGETVVEITTDANTNDDLGASLEDIQRTPLDRLSSDQVDNVVRRIVDDESEAVCVAAFNSSI